MNDSNRNAENDFTERLLRGKVVRTRPGFETRFQDLKACLTHERIDAVPDLPVPFFMYLARFAAAAAVIVLAVGVWFRMAPERTDSLAAEWANDAVYIDDPFAWDEALWPAWTVLDEETLDAIFYFYYEDNS